MRTIAMALVGVLSTQLLHNQFIRQQGATHTVPANFAAILVNNTDAREGQPAYA